MAKKKTVQGDRRGGSGRPSGTESADKPATLKELLSRDVVDQLKAQAEDWKAEEEKQKQEKRKQADEDRRAELKKLENDFEHLLKNSSMDWKKFK